MPALKREADEVDRRHALLQERVVVVEDAARSPVGEDAADADAVRSHVMSQMGHTSAALALEVYSKMMARQRETGVRMDALVRGADWAQMGTNGVGAEEDVASLGELEEQTAAL